MARPTGILCFGVLLLGVALTGRDYAQSADALPAVGPVTAEVQCPQSGHIPDPNLASQVANERTVRLTLSAPGTAYQDPSVQNALLAAAVRAATQQCPITTEVPAIPDSVVENVGQAEIYGPPQTGAEATLLLRATSYEPSCMCWSRYDDVYRRASEAALLARTEQGNTVESAPYQPAAAADWERVQRQTAAYNQEQAARRARDDAFRAQMFAEGAARWDAWWARTWHLLKTLFWLAVVGSLGLWLITHWETLVRWYFLLTPHPAAMMVHDAVRGEVELDGEAFHDILAPVPGGRIEREVRAKQATDLAELAQESNAKLRRRANELRRRIQEEAAYHAAHKGLHDATVEQQLAVRRTQVLSDVFDLMKRNTANDERPDVAPQG